MSHPHAESCETLDCLTKPQDRETIDYRFCSLSLAFRHTISGHLNQTILAQKLRSRSAFAIMCMFLYSMHVMSLTSHKFHLHMLCVHKPPCSCPNPSTNEMPRTSVWLPSDDLLVLSSADKSPHNRGIDPRQTHLLEAEAYMCMCVCLCVSVVPWNSRPPSLRICLAQVVCHPHALLARCRMCGNEEAG